MAHLEQKIIELRHGYVFANPFLLLHFQFIIKDTPSSFFLCDEGVFFHILFPLLLCVLGSLHNFYHFPILCYPPKTIGNIYCVLHMSNTIPSALR